MPEAPRNQPGRPARSDAHRQVEALLDEVGGAIRQVEIERQLRMAHAELGDGGRQVPHAKRDPAGQPQPALRHDGCGAYHALRLVEVRQQLHAALVERLPRFGEREPARRPIQEPRVEVRLELRDLPRHRRGRDGKAFGGAGKTAQLDDLCKRGDGLKAIHVIYYCTDSQ